MAKKKKVQKQRQYNNRLEKGNQMVGDIDDPVFWKREVADAENSDIYQNWLKSGERVKKLASRHVAGRQNQQEDLVDIVGSVANALVAELVYQDPIPTCKAKWVGAEQYEPMWTHLLESAVFKSKTKHQINALRFLAWGMVALKRTQVGPRLYYKPVKAENMLFNKEYLEDGACPYEDARWMRERILMPLSVCKQRAKKSWDSQAVSELAALINPQGDPENLVMAWVWEIHYRDEKGEWKVITVAEDEVSILLQKKKKEPIPRPPYAILRRPGDNGIEAGILARIANLDESFNKILKRAVQRAENRADFVAYNKEMVGKQGEKRIKGGKKGVVLLPVTGARNAKEALAAIGIGEISKDEMIELNFIWQQVRLTTGAAMERLGGVQGGGDTTATEVAYIAREKQKTGGLSGGLIDEYLEEDIYNCAMWFRQMWEEGQEEGQEDLHEWFQDVMDEEDYMALDLVMADFSEDLHEFEFGIEPGSTQQMFNDMKIQKLTQLVQFTTQSPSVAEWLMQSGKRFKIEKFLEDLFRLAGFGKPEKWFEDLPQEEVDARKQAEMMALTGQGQGQGRGEQALMGSGMPRGGGEGRWPQGMLQ